MNIDLIFTTDMIAMLRWTFVDFALRNRIEIILFPLYSLHHLQALNVAVFSALKPAISARLNRFIQSGISWLQKTE